MYPNFNNGQQQPSMNPMYNQQTQQTVYTAQQMPMNTQMPMNNQMPMYNQMPMQQMPMQQQFVTVTTTTSTPQYKLFSKRFRTGNQIHLRVIHTQSNIACNNNGGITGNGKNGKWATWIVHKQSPGYVKLQNFGNYNNWLRIDQNRNLNGNGRGGKYCLMKIHRHFDGSVSLESAVWPGSYVGIGKQRQAKIASTGPHGKFQVLLKAGTMVQMKKFVSIQAPQQQQVITTTYVTVNKPKPKVSILGSIANALLTPTITVNPPYHHHHHHHPGPIFGPGHHHHHGPRHHRPGPIFGPGHHHHGPHHRPGRHHGPHHGPGGHKPGRHGHGF